MKSPTGYLNKKPRFLLEISKAVKFRDHNIDKITNTVGTGRSFKIHKKKGRKEKHRGLPFKNNYLNRLWVRRSR